jgi:putative Holliday junction resolvase
MRVLGIDVGRRRIGLAISDPSGTIARPLATLTVGHDNALERVAMEVARLAAEEDGLGQIVVGVPSRLDGSPTDQTAYVIDFVDRLQQRTAIPIARGDERLTSVDAESRLAMRERDWKKRKKRLDAAAAALILQEYLDRRPS